MKTVALKRAKITVSSATDDKDGAKKKTIKKATGPGTSAATELEVNNDDKEKNTVEGNGEAPVDENEANKTVSTESNAGDADRKDDADKKKLKIDDKEKRKKHVRLWCVHCRIECATFKVNLELFVTL